MFKLNKIYKFKMLVDGEIRTLEGRVVGRTFEDLRHYDFKVGDNIFHNIPENDINYLEVE